MRPGWQYPNLDDDRNASAFDIGERVRCHGEEYVITAKEFTWPEYCDDPSWIYSLEGYGNKVSAGVIRKVTDSVSEDPQCPKTSPIGVPCILRDHHDERHSWEPPQRASEAKKGNANENVFGQVQGEVEQQQGALRRGQDLSRHGCGEGNSQSSQGNGRNEGHRGRISMHGNLDSGGDRSGLGTGASLEQRTNEALLKNMPSPAEARRKAIEECIAIIEPHTRGHSTVTAVTIELAKLMRALPVEPPRTNEALSDARVQAAIDRGVYENRAARMAERGQPPGIPDPRANDATYTIEQCLDRFDAHTTGRCGHARSEACLETLREWLPRLRAALGARTDNEANMMIEGLFAAQVKIDKLRDRLRYHAFEAKDMYVNGMLERRIQCQECHGSWPPGSAPKEIHHRDCIAQKPFPRAETVLNDRSKK